MKSLRSLGFFNLFLVTGIFAGYQLATFAIPQKQAIEHYRQVGEISPKKIDTALVLSSSFIEHETPSPGQFTEETTAPRSNSQRNYLVVLVEKTAFSPPDKQVDILISQIYSIWLVISQPGNPRLTWQPINIPTLLQSYSPVITYTNLFDYLKESQNISFDHYLIINRSGIDLAAHLLGQVIHHIGNTQDADSLYRTSNRLSNHKLDIPEQARNMAQLCSLIPDTLTQVDVNRFLNLMHASYYTDINKMHIQSALFSFQDPGAQRLICDFPILKAGSDHTIP